jgi:DNA-binding transcriptional ArsR family regulator
VRPAYGLDTTLAALADPNRRKVVDLLRSGPRPAGDIARVVGVPPPAMSRALKALKDAGLVTEHHPAHDSRLRIYELRTGPMGELRDWLAETEAMWSEQLSAFRDHLAQET